MRVIHAAVLVGIMALAVPILKAHADTDVLLPSGDNSSSQPNLGLVPRDSSSSSSDADAPTSNMPVAPTPSDNSNLSSGYVSTYEDVTPASADPQASAPTEYQLRDMKELAARVASQQKAAAAAMKTTVIQQPDMAKLVGSSGSLPNSIDVAVVAGKINQFNSTMIHNQLGIPVSDIDTSCQISVGGMIQTSKGSSSASFFDLGSTPNGSARFDGKINLVMASISALCDTSHPLPQNMGPIFQTGDKYRASLGSAQCSAPATGSAHKITVSVPQDGMPVCTIS